MSLSWQNSLAGIGRQRYRDLACVFSDTISAPDRRSEGRTRTVTPSLPLQRDCIQRRYDARRAVKCNI